MNVTVGGQHRVDVGFSQHDNRPGSLFQGVLSSATSQMVRGKCYSLGEGSGDGRKGVRTLRQDGRRRAAARRGCPPALTPGAPRSPRSRGPRFIRSSRASSAGGAEGGEALGFPWSSTHSGGFQIQKDRDAVSRWVPRTARTSALLLRVPRTVIY